MFYEKGSFTIVPNKEHLRGKSTLVQTVFFWICSYADEYGTCFPSRKRLAVDCNTTVKSIDRALKELETAELVFPEKRKDGVKNLTNLYHVVIPETLDMIMGTQRYKKTSRDIKDPRVGTQELLGVGTQEPQITIPVITNQINSISETSSQVFSWEKYLEGMLSHSRKDLNIIGFFFKTKGISFSTKAKADTALRRHLKAAKQISPFDKKEIGEAMRRLSYDFPKFTVETVYKELTK